MFVGGLNLVRVAAAKASPMPEGMGNIGFGDQYKSRVTLNGGGKEFNLPCDPLIAVGFRNEIVKRSVAKPKNKGTIKENWAVGDWSVTISGIIIAETEEELGQLVKQLTEICAVRESLQVVCPPLNDFYGINNIAIESIDLPFTSGMLNQQFTIQALSDTSYELLEKI